MKATLYTLAGLILLAVVVISQTKPNAEAVITIDEFKFLPATVTVPAGTTVRWKNNDDVPHTVASEDKSFKSKALDTNDEFTFTFTKPGEYNYFCSLHPKMTGKIVVE
jgi:plastocyanin